MNRNSLENVFNAYFNNKKNFSDFYNLRTDEEVDFIPLKRKGGGVYKCSARLKAIHSFLSRFVFSELPVRKDIVFSYRKEVNITEAVSPHCKSEYIFKTDLSNFFPSVTADAISEKLTKYCHKINSVDAEDILNNLDRIIYLCTFDNRLPIGFASSPSVSNFCFYDYDNAIDAYCKKNNFIYTRYADDLILSSQNELQKETIMDALTEILTSDASLRLTLNYKKTKVITKKYERKILGISILNDGKMTVSRAMKTDIEVKLHLLRTDREKLIDYTGTDEMTSILSIAGVLSQINNVDKDFLYHLRRKYGNAIISKLLRGKELLK